MRKEVVTVAIVSLSLLSAGCYENDSTDHDHGSGNDVHGPSASQPAAAPTASVTLAVYSGSDFECFNVTESGEGQIWCRDAIQSVNRFGPNFIRIADHTADFTGLGMKAHTVCYEATVAQRPNERDSGVATYCTSTINLTPYGALGLGVNEAINPMSSTDGSSDLNFGTFVPNVGFDVPLSTVMMLFDGSPEVQPTTLTCSLTSKQLDCGSFQIDMN